MAEEHLLFPQFPRQAEPKVEQTLAASERPAPSAADERLADDVFTPGQRGLATAFLGLQTGLAIMHHLALETFQRDEEEEEEHPRHQPRPLPAV
jgi:hypothetical protein